MKKTVLLAAAALLGSLGTPALADDAPDLMSVYKHLHANPELSMMEFETAKYLASHLKELGFDVTEEFGKTGVVAVMKNGPGKTVMVRADMDALPVKEMTGLPFASEAS